MSLCTFKSWKRGWWMTVIGKVTLYSSTCVSAEVHCVHTYLTLLILLPWCVSWVVTAFHSDPKSNINMSDSDSEDSFFSKGSGCSASIWETDGVSKGETCLQHVSSPENVCVFLRTMTAHTFLSVLSGKWLMAKSARSLQWRRLALTLRPSR